MLPEQFIDRLRKLIPKEQLASVLDSFSVRKPSTFRVNTLRISSHDLMLLLQEQGITVEPVSWYKYAYILKNVSQRVLTETLFYKKGFFYVQSLSSMIPPLVLAPEKGEKILDIASSPGSKTTQIASMMENTGEIIANDKSKIRMYKLLFNLKMQGVSNTKTHIMPGQIIWKRYPEYFDRALVDAPCSLEGMFDYHNPKSYRDWSLTKIKQLVQVQRFLLRSAISAVKVGGSIVYSTCTLSPEENEGVIDWILQKEKDAIEMQDITLSLPTYMYGISVWNNKTLDKRVEKAIRILPSLSMEAFFIAKIKKIKSTFSSQSLVHVI
jgi:16S rRNA (cytosine1407-C5)-methyltransferase